MTSSTSNNDNNENECKSNTNGNHVDAKQNYVGAKNNTNGSIDLNLKPETKIEQASNSGKLKKKT